MLFLMFTQCVGNGFGFVYIISLLNMHLPKCITIVCQRGIIVLGPMCVENAMVVKLYLNKFMDYGRP